MSRFKKCLMLMVPLILVVAMGAAMADEAKLVRGDVWQKLSQNEKTVLIWGMGQIVTVEEAIWEKMPELKVANFCAKVVEGMADIPIENITGSIDQFYAANPDKLETSVVRVIWDKMIKPNLKTGIGDKPL